MPVKMLQRQQLLYEMDYGANRLRFADSDATLRECAAMVGYVFDSTAERAVLGVFEIVGAVSTYTPPPAPRAPPTPSTNDTHDRGQGDHGRWSFDPTAAEEGGRNPLPTRRRGASRARAASTTVTACATPIPGRGLSCPS